MKKSIMLSIAAAVALFVANPGEGHANTEKTNHNVYQQQYVVSLSQFNQQDLQKMIDNYVKKLEQQGFQVNWQVPKQQAKEPSAQQPVQQEPVQVQPPQQQQPVQNQPAQTEQPMQTEQQQSALSQFELRVVELTNAERAKHGLAPLQVDEQLSKVARQKSIDMKQNNYFAHQSPTYGSPFDMMNQFGVQYRSAAENIAMGQRSPEEVVNAWMNSSGHRQNILNSGFTHIGVGHAAEGNYWTQMFISK
ncbi:CAP domain-containing protein [Anaerobacillus sp. MEB173]|uniref:CAP domain-containing protein n=1 Tax=Anaerobacillus sp. MEB173 TaxID=3383345 RepID=UPI003F8E2C63